MIQHPIIKDCIDIKRLKAYTKNMYGKKCKTIDSSCGACLGWLDFHLIEKIYKECVKFEKEL